MYSAKVIAQSGGCVRREVRRAGHAEAAPWRVLAEIVPSGLEDVAGAGIEQDEVNGFQGGFALQMLDGFAEHDLRAFVQGKAGNAGAHAGKAMDLSLRSAAIRSECPWRYAVIWQWCARRRGPCSRRE